MNPVERAREAIREAIRQAISFHGFGVGDLPELRQFGRAEARRRGAAITNRELDRLVREVMA